jgi:flavin-dependent dehydrogenase
MMDRTFREHVDFDAVIIGAGPAWLAAARITRVCEALVVVLRAPGYIYSSILTYTHVFDPTDRVRRL